MDSIVDLIKEINGLGNWEIKGNELFVTVKRDNYSLSLTFNENSRIVEVKSELKLNFSETTLSIPKIPKNIVLINNYSKKIDSNNTIAKYEIFRILNKDPELTDYIQ